MKALNLFTTIITIVVLSLTVSSITAKAAVNPADAIVAQINAERKAAGLSIVTVDKDLTAAAVIRAQEASTLFSHIRPDGTDYWTINPDKVWAENLAEGTADQVGGAQVVALWMASPVHRANILYKDSTSVGVALTVGENGRTYVALLFN